MRHIIFLCRFACRVRDALFPDAIMIEFSAVTPLLFSQRFFIVGTWLSLVEHSLGVRGVGSSNLPVPTIHIC